MNFLINIIAGSIVGWYAFKAAKAGNITASIILALVYIFITIYFT